MSKVNEKGENEDMYVDAKNLKNIVNISEVKGNPEVLLSLFRIIIGMFFIFLMVRNSTH